MAYIYRHIRIDTNMPFYIGISNTNDEYKRAYSTYDRSTQWKRITNKTEFEVEILIEDLTCKPKKESLYHYMVEGT